jgi:glycosyltransferase involved in cell wall biosynthesis
MAGLNDLAVVVPVRNAEHWIESCLESIARSGPAEIIVVDGLSSDRTVELARSFGVRILSDAGQGVAAARHMGVEAASTPYVALIDVDVVLPDGALENLLGEFASGGYIGLQAGLHSVSGPGYWGRALAAHHRSGRSKDWFGVGATIFRRDALLEHGFDERFNSGEDIDLRWRLQRAGAKTGVSRETLVQHRFGDTWEFAKGQWIADGRGLARMLSVHRRRSVPLLLLPLAAALRGAALSVLRLQPQWLPYYACYFVFNYLAMLAGLVGRPRSLRPLSLLAVVGAIALIAIAGPAAATQIFSDGFESGTLNQWTVQKGGDGTASADTAVVVNGTYAARISASANAGSFATLRKTFNTPQTDLTVAADVRVLAQGASSSGNVPLFKIYDPNGSLLVQLYRPNGSSGRLYVKHDGAFNATNGFLPMDTWRRVELHTVTAGAGASTVEVKVTGQSVYKTTTASLGTAGVATLQLGNDVKAQPFTIAVDDVLASNSSTDTTPPETTIDSGPQGSVASTSATFSFSSEAGATFECSLDGSPWSGCSSPKTYNGLADGQHTFGVRAIDQAGNVDATPAERVWTVVLGSGCDASEPVPTTSDPGTVAIADNFEDQDFSNWVFKEQGDADIRIQSDAVHSGRCAAELDVTTATWDSRAYLQKVLPERTNEVWADGWFDVDDDGESPDWNSPTFRFFTGGKRVLDVSRQNQNGSFFVRYPQPSGGFKVVGTGRTLAIDRWYHIKVHAVANGNVSTVQVWLDGTKVFETNTATLGVSEIEAANVGAEHQNQEGEVAVDDVVLKTIAAPPTDVVFSDGFESGGFAQWTAAPTGGDGTAVVQGADVRGGTQAAKLTATPNAGSFAGLKQTLLSNETDLTVSADLKVAAEGDKGGTTPLIGLNDAGGLRTISVFRYNQNGDRIGVSYGGTTYTATGTLPLGRWANLKVRAVTGANGTTSVQVWLDDVQIQSGSSSNINTTGVKQFVLGAVGPGKGFTLLADNVVARRGTAGAAPDAGDKLLIADFLNKRILITDFAGRVVWKFDNPLNNPHYLAGPVGVRWLPNNKILATFGTSEIGVIDVATKTFDWKLRSCSGESFQSAYDAELLPDGNVAIALRYNEGGKGIVCNRTTGLEIWKYKVPFAHSITYRAPAQSYNTSLPTLLIGGWGAIREVTYDPGGLSQEVTWSYTSEFTHDVVVLDDDTLLTTEGYYIQKLNRDGTRVWKKNTPEENRRAAVNPNLGGGYVWTVAEGDRIEFRDKNGNLLRGWSRLSDDTILDFPYGLQVIEYPG